MKILTNDTKIKIKKLFEEKKYSKLEIFLENLKNLDHLPTNIQMIYAVSKALNPKSNIQDYKKSETKLD